MKCVKCDVCGKVVASDFQACGNAGPDFAYQTLLISNGGDININVVNYEIKHLCLDCANTIRKELKIKNGK